MKRKLPRRMLPGIRATGEIPVVFYPPVQHATSRIDHTAAYDFCEGFQVAMWEDYKPVEERKQRLIEEILASPAAC
jgi:hypothetical protein